MRRLSMVIWLVVVLVAVVTGCSGAHRYNGRLVAADSLMRSNPDSALALLEALPVDSLTTEGDRAYRGLLISQARYKAYVTATSDSDINRALSYYRAHSGEREKLTRSYIYKGAVMEELGHPDSAMYYYKSAEATAAPDDYFNLGYCKLRIAEMYQTQISQDSAAIIRLRQSIHCFEVLRDTNYLIVASGIMGAISGIRCPDTTKFYLKKAVDLSLDYDPSLQYTYKSKLAGILLYEENYLLANQLAMDVLRNGRNECKESNFYYYAALSFIKLNQIDSAKYVISITPDPVNQVDSLNRYDLLAEIAQVTNDNKAYAKYLACSKDVTSKILFAKNDKILTKSEIEYEVKQLEEKRNISHKKNSVFFSILATAILLMLLLLARLCYTLRKRKNERNAIKKELEHTLEELKKLQASNDNVSSLVRCRIAALNELYQDVRVKIEDDKKVKKIVPLSSVLKSMNDKNQILDVKLSDSFWEKMRYSVDVEFNGIMSHVEKHYTNLTKQDLQLFCLSCANISPQIIRLCMNYMHVKTVSNYKRKLIREKMGLDLSFDEFVQQYLSKNLT